MRAIWNAYWKLTRRGIYQFLCLYWRADRPIHMFRNGRRKETDFRPEELLYIRCAADDVAEGRLKPPRTPAGDPGGKPEDPGAVNFPNQSTNWSRFSFYLDVLIPNWIEWGVAAIAVRDIPGPFVPEPPPFEVGKKSPKNQTKPCTFEASHEPEEDNYSHTEIATRKDGQIEKKGNIHWLAKKHYRMEIARHSRVLVPPLVPRGAKAN